jgi:hypothetical protein
VRTTVGQMEIRAYWNSGLEPRGARRPLRRAERALNGCTTPICVRQGPHFMDQLSLAAVTADVHDRVRVLSDAYNYPLRHRASLTPEAVELDLADLVHVHYRLWLHMPDALARVNPPFDPATDRYAWLAERLPLEPTVEDEG